MSGIDSSALRVMEERLKSFFKSEIVTLVEKMERIEDKLLAVQSECIRIDGELSKVKSIISNQQLIIEKHEQKLRARNVIIHNIPEGVISVDGDRIRSDIEKVNVLCRSAEIDVGRFDLTSVSRIGRSISDKARPLLVTVSKPDCKFSFLNARRKVTNDPHITDIFKDRIFINPDSSPLVRKEERRLRMKLKALKNDNPNSKGFIKGGNLFVDDVVVDQVDVRNQLF